MRLIDIKEKIKIAHANNLFRYDYSSSTGLFTLYNIHNLQIVLETLRDINFFSETDRILHFPVLGSTDHAFRSIDIDYVYDNILSTNLEKFSFDKKSFDPIRLFFLNLESILNLLYNWFEYLIPEEQDNQTLNIKLPVIKGLDNLSKVANDLKISISTVVNSFPNGKVEIKQFDHGSFWLVLGVGSALTLIASLTWSAAVIAKKINEFRYTNGLIENLNIRNEALNEVKEALKEKIKIDTSLEAELIKNEFFSEDKNNKEQAVRIEKSITILAELILKGTEFHPAITSSEDVSNLFPNYKNLLLNESKIKKIEE
ncbi:hypothetical protein [Dysgonomonas sp. Marseille-P4361]|uniref:hypothetical protein n=1 Tax=Dysgonomonas sp. Marseille-P4361 TaxID=2161820 RepID=UPI000D562D12|nr:hypothetical protein [Dysgonomonas sp. Marseille-P4361]